MDDNQDDSGTESPILLVRSVRDSEEADGVDGVAPFDGGVDYLGNEGTNCAPGPVERRIIHSIGQLDRRACKSAS